MSWRYLIDANLLIYPHDPRDPVKAARAAAVLLHVNTAESAALPAQTPDVVLEAVRGVRDHRLSYYDAQIWAVAKLNQIPAILSEDFNVGAVLEGVTFINPLDPTFVLETLA